MTLPTSGPISLGAIQTEFGGANPIAISEYYRGGSRVNNTGANAAIPTSGLVRMSNYRGGTGYVADYDPNNTWYDSGSASEYSSGNVTFNWPARTISGITEPITISFSTTTGFVSASSGGGEFASPVNSNFGLSVSVVRGGSVVTSMDWGFSSNFGSGGAGTSNISRSGNVIVQNGDIIYMSASQSVSAPEYTSGFGSTTSGYGGCSITIRNVTSGNAVLDSGIDISLSVENTGGY